MFQQGGQVRKPTATAATDACAAPHHPATSHHLILQGLQLQLQRGRGRLRLLHLFARGAGRCLCGSLLRLGVARLRAAR
jgi:hypothetical protein